MYVERNVQSVRRTSGKEVIPLSAQDRQRIRRARAYLVERHESPRSSTSYHYLTRTGYSIGSVVHHSCRSVYASR